MISIKCGSCGMVFNVMEENVAKRTTIGQCSNCGASMPSELGNAICKLAVALESPAKWKAYILPDPEELRKLQL